MEWWVWVILGFVLLVLELLTTTIHVGFFGVGAMIVGLLVAVGVGGPLWMQFLLFSIVSVLLLVLFRKPLIRLIRTDGPDRVDAIQGEVATATGAINPGELGRAELRGTSWSARNGGQTPIEPGQRCIVERVEGLTLWIRAD